MQKETWRDIPSYEGLYQVSDLGNVRSLDKTARMMGGSGANRTEWRRFIPGKPIARRKHRFGYWMVTISKNDKAHHSTVHKLVLLAFIGPRPEGYEAAHLNSDPSDCRLQNLAWVTRAENTFHKKANGTYHDGERHPSAKLTETKVREIISLKGLSTQRDVAAKYGVVSSHVSALWSGRAWKHLKASPQS